MDTYNNVESERGERKGNLGALALLRGELDVHVSTLFLDVSDDSGIQNLIPTLEANLFEKQSNGGCKKPDD